MSIYSENQMTKELATYDNLNRLVEKFEDRVFQIEKNVSDFLEQPHTAKIAREKLRDVREEERRFYKLVWVCRKFKRMQNKDFRKTAEKLCSSARNLRVEIGSVARKLTEDLAQCQQREEAAKNKERIKNEKREVESIKKIGFMLGTPIGFVTIYQMIQKADDSYKLIIVGLLIGTGIAYNQSVQNLCIKAHKTFSTYYKRKKRKKQNAKGGCSLSRPNHPKSKTNELNPK